MKFFISSLVAGMLVLSGCCHRPDPTPVSSYPIVGSVERLDPALDRLIAPGAEMSQLAEGFEWAEGPVWVPDGGYLLFSDIPNNVVLKWQDGQGITEYLRPSGYTGTTRRDGEPGSNGLMLDSSGRLVLCEHGDRRVSRLNSDRSKTTLASHYQGKRLNSPNDLVFKSNGDLYFTDPPYGLEGNVNDPKKELPYQGVYRLAPNGGLTLLTDELSRPNGIAFSPDEKTLYVANSDPKRAIWMAYDVQPDGTIANGRVFADVTDRVGKEPGLPDGLTIDSHGNLYATGPGGVRIFSPEGKQLGVLRTGQATANCAWGNNGDDLYITADMLLLRIPVIANR